MPSPPVQFLQALLDGAAKIATLFGGTNYLDAEVTVADALEALDTQVKANADAVGGLDVATAKGDLVGFSTEPERFPVGADGKALIADSATATGLAWATPETDPLTAKGDVFTFGVDATRLPVGAADTFLTPDAAQATGLKWDVMARASIADGKMLAAGDTLRMESALVAGLVSTTEVAAVIAGGDFIDPAKYVATDFTVASTFRAIVACDEAAAMVHVELYNVTDAASVATLTHTADTDTVELTQALGAMANFKATKKHYRVRYWVTGGATPTVFLEKASVDFLVSY